MLIHETYQCSRDIGRIEYGFTFKRVGDDGTPGDDSEFDLVLGEYNPHMPDAGRQATIDWEKHEWAARAICAASKGASDMKILIDIPERTALGEMERESIVQGVKDMTHDFPGAVVHEVFDEDSITTEGFAPNVRYEPFIDGSRVGYKVTRLADSAVAYLYFNPSESGMGEPDVFVYCGPHDDPSHDDSLCFVVPKFEEA